MPKRPRPHGRRFITPVKRATWLPRCRQAWKPGILKSGSPAFDSESRASRAPDIGSVSRLGRVKWSGLHASNHVLPPPPPYLLQSCPPVASDTLRNMAACARMYLSALMRPLSGVARWSCADRLLPEDFMTCISSPFSHLIARSTLLLLLSPAIVEPLLERHKLSNPFSLCSLAVKARANETAFHIGQAKQRARSNDPSESMLHLAG